jgi:hypothetical protein
MDPDTLLTNWGFKKNPFRVYVAEKEKDTAEFFLEPPYFKDVLGNAQTPQSAIVFGQRGDGKSTLCKMVEHHLDASTDAHAPLLIKYMEFPKWLETDIRELTIEEHIERIIRLALESFIKRAEKDLTLLQNLSKPDQALLQWYILVFFPSGEFRQVERRLTSLIDRLPKKYRVKKIGGWGVRRVINYLRKRRVEIERVSDDKSPIVQIIKSVLFLIAPSIPEGNAVRDHTDIELFKRLRDLMTAAGFPSIVILIDKTDENEVCSNRPDLAAQLIKPLVTSVNFLEIEGVATKFFLPSVTKEILGTTIRTDRLTTRDISWSDDGLRHLLRRRLRAFSNGSIDSLERFVDQRVWPNFEDRILYYSAQSPRNMIRLLDSVTSVLCALEESPEVISSSALDVGIHNFLALKNTEYDAQEYQKRLANSTQGKN